MRRLFLAVLAAVAVTNLGLAAFAAEDTPSAKVIAYYFHGSFRCLTCHRLEQYSKEVIETNFKDALASGRLEFKVINVEERGNEHFIKDYQLYTKSLVVSLRDGDKEVKSKNLTKIWDYVGNRQKFFDYVTSEINSLLKDS